MQSLKTSAIAVVLCTCLAIQITFTAFFVLETYFFLRSARGVADAPAGIDSRLRERRTLLVADFQQSSGSVNTCLEIQTVLLLIVYVVYLAWVYHSHAELQRLGALNLRFTHRWAVVFHFVPISNLIRPHQILQEIWSGSDPVDPTPYNSEIPNGHGSDLVRTWWISAVLLGGLSWYSLLVIFGEGNVDESLRGLSKQAASAIRDANAIVIASVAFLVTQMLLFLIVRAITTRQLARRRLLSRNI